MSTGARGEAGTAEPVEVLAMFPGQGAQRPGMASWLRDHPAARAVFDIADDVIGFRVSELCAEGSAEQLRDTSIAQPAIVATSLALMAVANEQGLLPTAVAGHSLGEFTALSVAGVFSVESTLTLVGLRGRLMGELGARRDGAMSAIIGPASDAVRRWCEDVPSGVVVVANYNDPHQTVVSGDAHAVRRVEERAGSDPTTVKVVRLRVGGAFHSPLMAGAVEEFGEELRRHRPCVPRTPVLGSVDADYVASDASVVDLMCRQLVSPVRWVDTVRRAESDGYRALVEVGPGRALTGFAKRTTPHVRAVAMNTPDAGAVEELYRTLSPEDPGRTTN